MNSFLNSGNNCWKCRLINISQVKEEKFKFTYKPILRSLFSGFIRLHASATLKENGKETYQTRWITV